MKSWSPCVTLRWSGTSLLMAGSQQMLKHFASRSLSGKLTSQRTQEISMPLQTGSINTWHSFIESRAWIWLVDSFLMVRKFCNVSFSRPDRLQISSQLGICSDLWLASNGEPMSFSSHRSKMWLKLYNSMRVEFWGVFLRLRGLAFSKSATSLSSPSKKTLTRSTTSRTGPSTCKSSSKRTLISQTKKSWTMTLTSLSLLWLKRS